MTEQRPRSNALWQRICERADAPAIVWRGREVTSSELMELARKWVDRLAALDVRQGTVCGCLADYSPEACALILALIRVGAVVVPFARGVAAERARLEEIAQVERLVEIDEQGTRITDRRSFGGTPLLQRLRGTGHPGLIVFTSGSTGEPKAILHDFERLLGRFETRRVPYRTLLFLLIDHFGGINTLISVLSYGGVAVIPEDRSPGKVAAAIEQARVELLPVTPTFLNMLLASEAYRRYDLSSVKLITYGTEVMPEVTLHRLRGAFPNAQLQQTYGLSELGVLRTKSKDSESLWFRMGGSGFETRVIDGILHVRSDYAMLGYLNAPDAVDGEGWMNTGDVVLQEGDWLRVLGRASDVINVGGQKVFPAEVETVLLEAENVTDATVHGEPHPLMGSMVVAAVALATPEDDDLLRQRLRAFCRGRLAPYKIPVKFRSSVSVGRTERFKKERPHSTGEPSRPRAAPP